MKDKINTLLNKIDTMRLWIWGVGITGIIFAFYAWLGEECVFTIHDQLDETICSYVFMARHLFEGVSVYPEMMNGIEPGGMFPSAVLFVPLYRIFPLFWAFLIQFLVITLTALLGMYGVIKKLTGSSIVALIIGMIFSVIPIQPVYGLSVVGVPMLFLCFMQLYKKEKKMLSMLGIIYFGLTTHLVLIGYVALIYLGIFSLINLCRKKWNIKEDIWFYAGVCLLFFVYCIVYCDMFLQMFTPAAEFVSHRVEFVNQTENIPFWTNIKNIFLYGVFLYAPSYHHDLLPVCLLITVIMGILYKKLSHTGKGLWKIVLTLWVILIVNVFLYAFLSSNSFTEWRNTQDGFFKYFQFNRFYWMYPTLWWILIGLCFGLLWIELTGISRFIKGAVIFVLLIPTLITMSKGMILGDNIGRNMQSSPYNAALKWKEHFMQDVMEQVDQHIGKDKTKYRVAHIGLNPTPALIYGFYTVDGYSNNYSLEYKHEFRKVIEKELEKNEALRIYYDTWGSRCYLFSAEGDHVFKWEKYVYQDLELNISKLKELGCEYILSASEIGGKMDGLVYEGTFDTAESIYEVWLYRIE